jgi:hypothetical protein
MNNETVKLTQLIYACWLAADSLASTSDALPTFQGVMDYTLKDLKDDPLFPEWAKNALHFSVRDSGLTCLELPEIRLYANRLGVTSDPNPSYTRTTMTVDGKMAPLFSRLAEIDANAAETLGKKMRAKVTEYTAVLSGSAA